MGSFCFKYFPLLDDYIQYGTYPFVNKPFCEVYIKARLFAYRPFAGLADIYLWGRFWGALGAALFIITLMHAASAYLFMITAENLNAPLGMLFTTIYLLCPINFEASYWISASTRIIIGLFFTSLSAYFASKEKNIAHFVFQFIAMFLYEQIAALSFAVSLIIICRKKQWRGLFPLAVNMLIFILYYAFFVKLGYMRGNISREILQYDKLKQIIYPWLLTNLYTKGFVRGIKMGGLNIIAMLIISVCFGAFEKRNAVSPKMLLVGGLLFIAPQVPILLLSGNNVSFRTCAPSLVGAAIMADTWLCNSINFKRLATVVLSFIFLVVSISELADYRENYLVDRKIVQYVSERLNLSQPNAVIGAKDTYIEQNVFFVDHIKSVTSSDWALTGCIRQHLSDRTIPMIEINPSSGEGINLIDF
ncbi:MAG: hypothetical protein M0R40_10535 [Firmicutes bacterium]|nr:hypothetical protein [Bacillota bacterium]